MPEFPSPISSDDEFAKVRPVYVEADDEWYFVIVDVIALLTDTAHPSRSWTDASVA